MYGNDFHGPDKASSIIGPEIFDDLKIELWCYTVNFVCKSLNYSFLNFPKLQSFKLYYNETYQEDMVLTIGYTHKKEDPIGSDQSNYTINLLEMECTNPDQCYFDLVVTYMKDISVMLFKKVFYWGYLYDHQVINLTDFKKLKSFIYTTKGRKGNQDSDVVLFKYTNGEEQYYYPDEEKRENAQVEYVGNSTTTPNLTVICDSSVTFTLKRY